MDRRLPAIDWMRGLVMVLMTFDHASDQFDAHHLMTDAVFMPQPNPLPPVQFLARWITHLCAPTFVFLAGTSLALSVSRRAERGEPVDAFIVKRGLFIAAMDPLWMSWMFMEKPPSQQILFQVLYAIGMSFVAMALLRRLPAKALFALGLAIAVGFEALAFVWKDPVGELTVRGGQIQLGQSTLLVAYPFVPWLAIMMLGWSFGEYLRAGRDPRRALVLGGVAALATYAVVRGLNFYGNAGLFRRDGSFIEWLHVAKYPPSLAYDGLELGIMALLLAGFFSIPQSKSDAPVLRPLRLFGQTAFFFYLLHAHLLFAAALLTGMHKHEAIPGAILATLLVCLVLAPMCRWYLGQKRRYPQSVLRYV